MKRDSVFISYRRSDTSAVAGHLADFLRSKFGKKRVFFDVASVQPGEQFPDRIRWELDRASVVLVLIGKNWSGHDCEPCVKDPEGGAHQKVSASLSNGALRGSQDCCNQCVKNPEDWVHQEAAASLSNGNIWLLPVLVDDAEMPRPEKLPGPLKSLASRNSMPLRHAEFEVHAKAIAREIGKALQICKTRIIRLLGIVLVGILISVVATTFSRCTERDKCERTELCEKWGKCLQRGDRCVATENGCRNSSIACQEKNACRFNPTIDECVE
jgi:hypothetical protein